MMVPHENNFAKTLLCGDLTTVALILGLKPVLHWTDATSVWQMKQSGFLDLLRMYGTVVVFRPVILWKPVDTCTVRYDADELARLVLSV
jgi:hypothetical protein